MPHLRLLPFIFTLAVALMSGACRDGSAPMPVIVTVSPTGIVGVVDEEVEFSVTVPPESPDYTFAWDFESGATPNTPTGNPVTVTLGAADTYSGEVTVSDGETVIVTEPFEYTVKEATIEVTAVALSPAEGLPLAATTLTAATEGERPVAWEWEFADGALPATSTDEGPEVVRQNAGTYTGRVRVMDDEGLWSRWFEFEYEVTVPVAPDWATVIVAQASNTRLPAVSATIHDGKLAVLFNGAGGLTLARATVAEPTGPGDFAVHVIDPEGWFFGRRNIVSIEDRLVVIHGTGVLAEDDPEVRIAVSTSVDPAGAGDWTIYPIGGPATSPIAHPPSMGSTLVSRGDHLVAFWMGQGVLGMSTSSVALPDDAGDWDWSNPELLGYAFRPVGLEVNGHLLVGYIFNNGLGDQNFVSQSLVEDPDEPADWNWQSINAYSSGGYRLFDVGTWNGRPAATYPNGDSLGGKQRLYIANEPIPTSLPTDGGMVITLSAPSTLSGGGALAVSNSRLAVVYADRTNARLMLARQIGTDPTTEAQWERQDLGPTPIQGYWPAVVLDLDGKLVVPYLVMSGVDTYELRVAFADGPF